MLHVLQWLLELRVSIISGLLYASKFPPSVLLQMNIEVTDLSNLAKLGGFLRKIDRHQFLQLFGHPTPDRVLVISRLTGEIHLRDELPEIITGELEMDMRRAVTPATH